MASPATIDGCGELVLLGQGGFAEVFGSIRVCDGQPVAIKVALRRGDRWFAREVEALRRVGSPAAPRLLEVRESEDGRPILIMERLDGVPLNDWLAAAPRSVDEKVAVLVRACRAVAAVHRAGIIHRDLKPENLFLRASGEVSVLDFGLAHLDGEADDTLAPALTSPGFQPGTALYMSPEQWRGGTVDRRSDLYALGVVAFTVLTGRPPFTGEAEQIREAHLLRRPPRPSECADLSLAFDAVMRRCLAKEPDERYGDAVELAEAFSAAAAAPITRSTSVPASRTRCRTVALLGLDSSTPSDVALAIARPLGGELVRVSGARYVIGFFEASSPSVSLAHARECGRQLSSRGPVALHVAELTIRTTPRGIKTFGPALERLDDWWQNQLADDERARRVADPVGAEPQSIPLAGRAPVLQLLSDGARAALVERRPQSASLLGAPGFGKSRVVAAVVDALAPTARVLAVAGCDPTGGDTESVLRTLLAGLLSIDPRARSAAQVRRACRTALGAELADRSWAAVALVVGALDDDAPEVAPLLRVAGALRAVLHDVLVAAARAVARHAPLVIVVDDAHWADPISLGALDQACETSERLPLWILVSARPGLPAPGARWTFRRERLLLCTLDRLDREQTRAMLTSLLTPVQFVPEDLLEQLYQSTQGVPLNVVELTRALRRAGAIRRHPGGKGWYLAADELLRASDTPLAERLAARATNSVSPMLLALLRSCAALGEEFALGDIDALQATLESDGCADAMADASAGVKALVEADWIQPLADGRFGFRDRLVRSALERAMPPSLLRTLHDAIYRQLAARPGQPIAATRRRADHAAAAGHWAEAATDYLQLAEDMRRRHRYIDADQLYSATIALLPPAHALAVQAFAGRGKIRYRCERMADALEDLRTARRLSEAGDDHPLTADLLLEEATVLDWLADYRGSAALVERTAALVAGGPVESLRARHCMAVARSQFRDGQFVASIANFEDAATAAARLGEYETEVIARLMLAVAFATERRMPESRACFDRVIALCEAAGDRLHLAVALNNRMQLWIQGGEHELAVADARRAIDLARQIGSSSVERMAVTCLAYLLYWTDALDEAKLRARDAFALCAQSSELPGVEQALLLARICAARHEWVEVQKQLDWAVAHSAQEPISPLHAHFVAALRALTSPDAPLPLLSEASLEGLMIDEARELVWLHCRAAGERGDERLLASLTAWADELPSSARAWTQRFAELTVTAQAA